ncbi:MAG: Uma2 family endonuclease [Candidatus Eremiobacteraeota bacterium]|nr:Uma2 family endonuclease [Candidatus Eremiobacteraeota bacterium]
MLGPIIEQQTKPATEWVLGRAVQKMSPRGKHARTQLRIAAALLAWADRTEFGRVGTEWDVRIAPPGEERRTLVPDVAVISYEGIPKNDDRDAEFPIVAPDVVVEVLSPGEPADYIAEKRRVYLASGSKLVMEADPEREITLYDATGSRTLTHEDIIQHSALPDFSLIVSTIFRRP